MPKYIMETDDGYEEVPDLPEGFSPAEGSGLIEVPEGYTFQTEAPQPAEAAPQPVEVDQEEMQDEREVKAFDDQYALDGPGTDIIVSPRQTFARQRIADLRFAAMQFPEGSKQRIELEADFQRRIKLEQASDTAKYAGAQADISEERLSRQGFALKELLGGVTFGASDLIMNKMGIDFTSETTSDQVFGSITRLLGNMLTGQVLAGGVAKAGVGGKLVTNAKWAQRLASKTGLSTVPVTQMELQGGLQGLSAVMGLEGAKAALLVRGLTSGTVSLSNNLSQYFSGAKNLKDTIRDTAIGVVSSMIGVFPESWARTASGQIFTQTIADFLVDVTADAVLTRRMQDAGFAEWFIKMEIPQLAGSLIFSVQDAAAIKNDPIAFKVRQQEMRQFGRDLIFKARSKKTGFRSGLEVDLPSQKIEGEETTSTLASDIADIASAGERAPTLADVEDMTAAVKVRPPPQTTRDGTVVPEDTSSATVASREDLMNRAGFTDAEKRLSSETKEETSSRINREVTEADKDIASATEVGAENALEATRERVYANERAAIGKLQQRIDNQRIRLESEARNERQSQEIAPETSIEDTIKVNKAAKEWSDIERTLVPEDYASRSASDRLIIDEEVSRALDEFVKNNPDAATETEVPSADGSTVTIRTPKIEVVDPRSAAMRSAPVEEQIAAVPLMGEQRPFEPRVIQKQTEVAASIDAMAGLTKQTKKADSWTTLSKSLAIGMDHLSRVRNLSGENTETIIDLMAGNGQYGVKGVGKSTAALMKAILIAESPQDALIIANDWRLAHRKAPILPEQPLPPDVMSEKLSTPVESRQVPAQDEAELRSIALSDATRMGDLVTPTGEWGISSASALQAMLRAQDGALPTDPTARKNQIDRLRIIFSDAYKYNNASSSVRRSMMKRVSNAAERTQSARYQFANAAQKTGDIAYVRDYDELTNREARNKWLGEKRVREILKTSGVPDWEIAHKPQLGQSIKTVLALDPNVGKNADAVARAKLELEDYTSPRKAWKLLKNKSKASPEKAAKIDAELEKMAIPFDDQRNRYARLIENVQNELLGPTGVNVRRVQFSRWNDAWSQHGRDINKLTRLIKQFPDSKGIEKWKRELAIREAQVQKASPMMVDEKGGNTHVPSDVMRASLIAYQEGGEVQLRNQLATQTWGTRYWYWMTEANDVLRGIFAPGQKADAAFEETIKASTSIAIPREANPRTSNEVRLSDRNFISELYNHVLTMQIKAGSMDLANAMLTRIQTDTMLDKKYEALALEAFVRTSLGDGVAPNVLSRFFGLVNGSFWRSYALSVTNSLWFASRNLFQNVALLPSQIGYKNIVVGVPRAIQKFRNPNSRARQAYDNFFQQEIVQWRSMFAAMTGHQGVRDESSIASAFSQAHPRAAEGITKIEEVAGISLTWTDVGNRGIAWLISYSTAEDAVNLYLSGKITQGELERSLIVDNLPPAEAISMMEKFNEGARTGTRDSMDDFILAYAKKRNLNTNFDYRNSGRSSIEKTAIEKAVVGLVTWPRGAFEIVHQNAIKPLVNGFRTHNVDMVASGAHTIGMYIIGMYSAELLRSKIFGAKEDKEGNPVPTYHPVFSMIMKPWSPGAGIIFDNLKQLGKIPFGEAGDLRDIIKWFGEKDGALLLPVLPDLRRLYERVGDRARAGNVTYIMDALEYGGTTFADYKDREGWYENIFLLFFGTEKVTWGEAAKSAATLPFVKK